VHYSGGLGNNLWQYSASRLFASTNGLAMKASPIEFFNNLIPRIEGKKEYFNKELVTGHFLPNFVPGKQYVFKGTFERFEYFIGREDEVKLWCTPQKTTGDSPNAKDLVISIRRGWNNWPAETHCPDIGYYVKLLAEFKFRKLWICTDSPNDPYFIELAKHVNFEIYKGSPVDQFNFIMRAKRYLIAPSTFSFWASWVGAAEEIYWPRIPALNFEGTKHDWRPITDPRVVDV
jgi:hypothetical protein